MSKVTNINNQRVKEEVKREIIKYFEMNANVTTYYSIQGKFKAERHLQLYMLIFKKEQSQLIIESSTLSNWNKRNKLNPK